MGFLFQNFTWKVLSIVLAAVLWFFVLSSNTIEVSKKVDIVLDLPPGLVVSNDITDGITFRLLGSKFFLRTIVDSLKTFRIDLTSAKEGPTYYSITSDMLRLPIGVKVLSISPSRIYPILEPIMHKNVPIEVSTVNKLPPEFRLLKLSPIPKMVRIHGPQSRIKKIKALKVDPVDISEVHPDLRWHVPIKISMDKIKVDEDVEPKILIEVEPKGSNFRVAGVALKIFSDRKYTTNVKKVALYVRCPKHLTHTLTPKRMGATIDLRGKKPGQYLKKVKVKLPRGVKLIRVVPQKIKVQLK